MDIREKPIFLKWMLGLGQIYQKPIHEAAVEMYWLALCHFELSAIQEAFQIHLRNPDEGRFLPKPADVVKYLQGSRGNQALKAWSKVTKAISQVGAYASVTFDDAIIHVVVTEMGGWVSLCHCSQDELPFRGHEFEKRYMSYVLQPPVQYPGHLPGLIEHQEHQYGKSCTPPELMGDPEKAKKIFKQDQKQSLMEVEEKNT